VSDVTVVVSSFDGFQSTWEPFCHGFQKYWPDCPWPLTFITNHLDPPCGEAIKTGEDRNWTTMTQKALEHVGPIMLWCHDDSWLVAPPDTEAIKDFAEIIKQGHADYIRLGPCRSDVEAGIDSLPVFSLDPRLFVVPDDYEYRVSLQAALWRVSKFQSLLKDGESCWAFEVEGSKRARSNDQRFLASKVRVFGYPCGTDPNWGNEPVRRGLWSPMARLYAEREGIEIDFSRPGPNR